MHLPFITLNDKNKTRIKNDETGRKRRRRRKRGGDDQCMALCVHYGDSFQKSVRIIISMVGSITALELTMGGGGGGGGGEEEMKNATKKGFRIFISVREFS